MKWSYTKSLALPEANLDGEVERHISSQSQACVTLEKLEILAQKMKAQPPKLSTLSIGTMIHHVTSPEVNMQKNIIIIIHYFNKISHGDEYYGEFESDIVLTNSSC